MKISVNNVTFRLRTVISEPIVSLDKKKKKTIILTTMFFIVVLFNNKYIKNYYIEI